MEKNVVEQVKEMMMEVFPESGEGSKRDKIYH